MDYVIIDIETIRNEDMINLLPPVEAKGSLKDPVKIAKDIAEKEQKQVEKMGLSWYYGQIFCIGIKENGKDKCEILYSLNEKEILEKLTPYILLGKTIVTYNGLAFDIPFLQFRYWYHKLTSPFYPAHLRKYDMSSHIDIMQVVANWNIQGAIKLSQLAHILGFPVDDESDGSMVQSLYDEGKDKEIMAHCESDLLLTEKILWRLYPLERQMEKQKEQR